MIYFMYLFLGLAVMSIELSRKKRFSFDYLTYFNVIFVVAYIVTPVLLFHNSERGAFVSWVDDIFLLTLVSYVSALVGWVLGGNSVRRHIKFDDGKVVKTMSRYTFFIAVVAAVYIVGKGGLVNLLASGALVRYGYKEATSTVFDFLQNVYSAAEIVTYILFAMSQSDRYKPYHRLIRWNYLLVLTLFALYVMSISSRGAIANALIMHFIIFIHFRTGFLRSAVPIFLLLVVLTLFGKQFFFAVASSIIGESFVDAFSVLDEVRNAEPYANPVIEKVLSEFVHSINSLILVLSGADTIRYTYFSDFFLSLLRVIPQSITMQFVELPATISTVNTIMLTGVPVASIPPGLMAHFYYSLGLVGVVVGFFSYGFVGRKISDHIAIAVRGNDVIYAVYAYTAFTFGFFVSNGDPHVYFYGLLWPILVYYSLARSRVRPRRTVLAAPEADVSNTGHKLLEMK